MAQVGRAVIWATRPFAVLISFLFSALQVAPPAWAKTPASAEYACNAIDGRILTVMIGDLSETEQFDQCLREELGRLKGVDGTAQELAQAEPKSGEELLLDLAPPPGPKELQRQQAVVSDAGQPRQAYIEGDWSGEEQPRQAYIEGDWQGQERTAPQVRQLPEAAPQPQQMIVWVPCNPAAAAATRQISPQPQQQPSTGGGQPRQALLRKN